MGPNIKDLVTKKSLFPVINIKGGGGDKAVKNKMESVALEKSEIVKKTCLLRGNGRKGFLAVNNMVGHTE